MPTYVTFLRGLNVGGHTVKMDRLRSIFEGLELDGVESFIASGNIIFTTPKRRAEGALERQVESVLESELGFAVPTFLRTPAELRAVTQARPFGAATTTEGVGLYVSFLKSPLDAATKRGLSDFDTDTNTFVTVGREVYWRCETKLSESGVKLPKLERFLGTTTQRNMTTVRKLVAKYPDERATGQVDVVLEVPAGQRSLTAS